MTALSLESPYDLAVTLLRAVKVATAHLGNRYFATVDVSGGLVTLTLRRMKHRNTYRRSDHAYAMTDWSTRTDRAVYDDVQRHIAHLESL